MKLNVEGVKPMAMDFFVFFNGNCREAVEFYAQVFETPAPQFMMYGQAPPSPDDPVPEEVQNLILYTSLPINGSNIMFADNTPGLPFVKGNNVTLVYGSKNVEDIQTFFARLKAGGTVHMELQTTFFSPCYGMLTDKYGLMWHFSLDSGEMGA
jgi:PhnB protein